VRTFVAIYLAVGFLAGFGLFGWLAVSSVRRHGFRNAVRSAARTYVEELPLSWRVPVAAWMYLIALPLIAARTVVKGELGAVGAIFIVMLWLGWFALLRWHWRKARTRDVHGQPRRRLPAE